MHPFAKPCTATLALLIMLGATALDAGNGASARDPKVPPGRDPGGVAVALFDTGVNYTLPEIARRLARDGEGAIIGYDFHDDDGLPFDAKPVAATPVAAKPVLPKPGSARKHTNDLRRAGKDTAQARNASMVPIRHGTTVASILLAEAASIRLVPLRYKAGDPKSFARMVLFTSQTRARIVSMSLGGPKRADWQPFAVAARHFKDLLFIVSAGNDGRNIDRKPIYPAAFALPNVIVVASTDAGGRYPLESNWGAKTVDISTPGERVEALSFAGARIRVSGSSFAVPRIAALAARISKAEPGLRGAALKQRILALAVANPSERQPRSRSGWIPNPTLLYRAK